MKRHPEEFMGPLAVIGIFAFLTVTAVRMPMRDIVDREQPTTANGPRPALEVAAPPNELRALDADVDQAIVDHVAASAEWASIPLPADLSEGFTPTLAGLRDCTVDLWSQPEFLDMPWEEYSEWLPADSVPGHGPQTLGDYVGGLPTDGDLDNAMRDREVVDWLSIVCMYDVALARAYAVEPHRRGPEWQEATESIGWGRGLAYHSMLRRLERVTGYPHWTILWTIHEGWAADE